MRRSLALAPLASLTLVLGGMGAAHAAHHDLSPGGGSGARAAARAADPPPAGSVTLGQVATNVDGSCNGVANGVKMNTTNAATPGYTVPEDGVLTSFSFNSGTVAGGVILLALKPATGANTFDVAAKSEIQPVTPSTLNTYDIRIPVQAGWQLGELTTVTGMNCVFVGVTGDVVGLDGSFAQTDTQGVFADSITGRVNLSAELEPDADGDGYGDLTQDLCPQSATTHAACPPPNTTIKKAPPRKTTKRKVKVTFSSVPGAMYTCQVDKAAAVPCTSPFSKKLKVGKHKITVTATSPAGVADPTPPTVRFKIVKKK